MPELVEPVSDPTAPNKFEPVAILKPPIIWKLCTGVMNVENAKAEGEFRRNLFTNLQTLQTKKENSPFSYHFHFKPWEFVQKLLAVEFPGPRGDRCAWKHIQLNIEWIPSAPDQQSFYNLQGLVSNRTTLGSLQHDFEVIENSINTMHFNGVFVRLEWHINIYMYIYISQLGRRCRRTR